MSITVYGPPQSRAGRVIWLLKELGAPFENVPLDMFAGDFQKPDFLALNPMGQAPAMTDGDFAMAESLAINLYLAKRFGGPLSPASHQEDGRAVQWSMWVMAAMEPHFLPIVAHRTGLPPEPFKAEVAAKAEAALARPLGAFNAHLDRHGPNILGARFTVADLNVASCMAPGIAAGIDLSAYPKVSRWADAAFARPHAAGMLTPIVFPPPIVAHFLGQH